MPSPAVEVCSNCERQLEPNEPAYLWQSRVVCELCHELLSSGAVVSPGAPDAWEWDLKFGKLPTVGTVRVPLAAGEVAHFQFPHSSVYQHRVVTRDYVQQSEALTLYDDGLALTVGEARGRTVDRTADVCLGTGTLVLTSARMIFASPGCGLDVPWARVLSVTTRRSRVVVVFATGGVNDAPIELAGMEPTLVKQAIEACYRRRA